MLFIWLHVLYIISEISLLWSVFYSHQKQSLVSLKTVNEFFFIQLSARQIIVD